MKLFPHGFTIAVVSPAGISTPEQFDCGIKALQNAGATVKVMPNARNATPVRGYLAAEDTARIDDLQRAWFDESVSLILCARGGYGSMRLLDKLDWHGMRQRKVLLAGFSDITALHWGMCAQNIHTPLAAPMLKYFAAPLPAESAESVIAAIAGKSVSLKLPALQGTCACGHPLPGNLTVAAALSGTPYFPDCSGRILILEDVGESPYRIDRMLTQLRLTGCFEQCAGVIFGNFTDCGDPAIVNSVLADFAASVKCPVFSGCKFGHELPFDSFNFDAALEVHSC